MVNRTLYFKPGSYYIELPGHLVTLPFRIHQMLVTSQPCVGHFVTVRK